MDLSERLPEVDVPAVVVVGTRDQLTPVSHARRLAELLPKARLEVLPDAGHMLPFEHPDKVAELIRSLASAEAGEPPELVVRAAGERATSQRQHEEGADQRVL